MRTEQKLDEVLRALENIYGYHNKNLTKRQYYAIEDCIDKLKAIKEGKV